MQKKFLIIRFSSIGDIIFTTSLIRCLKQASQAEVHFLTKAVYADLLSSNIYLDKLWTAQKNLESIIAELKKQGFTHVIDLHNNLRSRKVRKALNGKNYIVNKHNLDKWMRIYFKIDRLPNTHVAERCIGAVKELGIKNDGQGMDFFFPQNYISTIKKPDKYVVLSIGAAHYTKQMPTNKLVQICDRLNYDICLLGGKDMLQKAGSIIGQSRNPKILNLVGKTSLTESADIIKDAELVISGDSGMLHLAAALKKSTVSIWGSTIPEFGVFPYYGDEEVKHALIQNNELGCRPCSRHGSKSCPKKHFKCMNALQISDVVEKIESFM